MQKTNDKLGLTLIVKDEITQADLEAWEAELPDGGTVKTATWRGAMLRGAMKAKIVSEPSVMPTNPKHVAWFGKELADIYLPLITVDPN